MALDLRLFQLFHQCFGAEVAGVDARRVEVKRLDLARARGELATA